MRKFKHSLGNLARLPNLVEGCDILQARIISQEVKQHGGRPYVVTAFTTEVWEKGSGAVTLGSSLTLLHERKPSQEPHILVELSSIDGGLVGIERFSDKAVALLALKRKFDALVSGFKAFTAGDDHDPAA